MSWRSQEATVQILNAIGNPIRKAAIEALNKGGMRFSQLLASCDLDYDHDAGHFHYHLSELIDRRIVEKTKDDYRLTEFGQRVAELLSSLDKECSFLFLKKPEGGERKVDTHKLKTEWLEPGKEIVFQKKPIRISCSRLSIRKPIPCRSSWQLNYQKARKDGS